MRFSPDSHVSGAWAWRRWVMPDAAVAFRASIWTGFRRIPLERSLDEAPSSEESPAAYLAGIDAELSVATACPQARTSSNALLTGVREKPEGRASRAACQQAQPRTVLSSWASGRNSRAARAGRRASRRGPRRMLSSRASGRNPRAARAGRRARCRRCPPMSSRRASGRNLVGEGRGGTLVRGPEADVTGRARPRRGRTGAGGATRRARCSDRRGPGCRGRPARGTGS